MLGAGDFGNAGAQWGFPRTGLEVLRSKLRVVKQPIHSSPVGRLLQEEHNKTILNKTGA